MAKITSPLMSMTAAGTIGDRLTFRTLNGQAVASKKNIPRPGASAAQVVQRDAYAAACAAWQALSPAEQAAWVVLGDARQITGFNAFLSAELQAVVAPSLSGAAPAIITNGGGQSATVAGNVTIPEGTELLVVSAASPNTDAAPVSMSFNGVAMTLVPDSTAQAIYYGVLFQGISVWLLVNPPVGTFQLSATWNSAEFGRQLGASFWKDVDTSIPLGIPVTANSPLNGTSPNPSASISGLRSNDICYGAVSSRNEAVTTGHDFTQLAAYYLSAVNIGLGTQYDTTSETMSWTIPPQMWAAVAVTIRGKG